MNETDANVGDQALKGDRDRPSSAYPIPGTCSRRSLRALWLSAAFGVFAATASIAHAGPSVSARAPVIGATSVDGTSGGGLLRVLSLRDYNTRVVVLGTTVLGLAAGLIGTFMLLRKRALMSDALSHATLPGIALAFIVMTSMGASGKSLPVLLLGGLISSILGAACMVAIRHYTRLKEDAALGIVLSVFFGFGVALLGVIQKMSTGSQAGLESFVYGKTASMIAGDAHMIAVTAGVVAVACALLFKEFALLCFDTGYARSQGWPVLLLDGLMMALVVAVTVIGLQAVGIILVIALLIIPPSAARFWTERLGPMVMVAAAIGALSGWGGAVASALVPGLPAGAIIVLAAGAAFLLSMLFGRRRGIVPRLIERHRLNAKVTRQNLLRALHELLPAALLQTTAPASTALPFDRLLAARAWTPRHLMHALAAARRDGIVSRASDNAWSLTEKGTIEARRVVRNHRLWELYLITHADIAASHVDRDADAVEHVLGPDMVRRLETVLAEKHPQTAAPPSPHPLVRA